MTLPSLFFSIAVPLFSEIMVLRIIPARKIHFSRFFAFLANPKTESSGIIVILSLSKDSIFDDYSGVLVLIHYLNAEDVSHKTICHSCRLGDDHGILC